MSLPPFRFRNEEGVLVETRAMTPETIKYFESLTAIYTDNIRSSDYRACTVLFLLAISISTIVAFRDELPASVPIFVLLIFPLFAIILLILSIYPRFIVTPGFPFYFRRSITPADFVGPPEEESELLALFRNRCAALATIFYWKMHYFRIALGISLFYLAILLILTFGGIIHELAFHSPPK